MTSRDLLRAGLVALVLLGSIPAYDRIFATGDWRLPALTAAAAALVTAAVVRAMGGGAIHSALASTVGFVALIPMLAGMVSRPTFPGTALRSELAVRISEGLVELQLTPAPAPLLAGLALFLVAGFWVVSHIAHELLVRWSRTGPALLVLAVLWTVPLIVPMTDSRLLWRATPFLAASAVLLLATTGHRLPAPRTAAAGVGMAALAITVAATAPGVLPGYQAHAWYGLGSGGSQPRGYQPIVDVSNRLQMPEAREVLRVWTSQPTYLRLAGLDSFDGFTWRLGTGVGSYRPDPSTLYSTAADLPPEIPAQTTEPVFVDVEVRDLANIYVPVPYQPVQVLGPYRDDLVWSTEGGFLATWDTEDGRLAADGPRVGVREGFTYRIQAERPVPTREDLLDVTIDDATLERYTELPREYPELAELAEQVYADADATSTIDRTLALQDWFTGPDGDFTYNLEVPALRGDDALERFIIDDRVGYCEYFATGMAVMLRATGIPARVATGFLPGEVVSSADDDGEHDLTEYSVGSGDAHAWVEVLFPGYGWITFEPTPRSDGTQMQPRADELTPLENERERRIRELRELQDGLDDTPVPDGPDLEPPAADATDPSEAPDAGAQADGTTITAASTSLLVLVLVVAVGVAAAGYFRVRSRGRARGGGSAAADQILSAQARMLDTAARYGIPRRRSETSIELARRWRAEHRVGDDALRFAILAQAAAFGGSVDDRLADEAEELADRVIADLRRSVQPRDRRVAQLRAPWHGAKRRARERLDARLRRREAAGVGMTERWGD